ncbi:MAG: signal peptide peptidase SppA [Bacteroidales bacterium]|nr:signal peptide peptidase SppA [Bacteroidales bacterium]
MRSFLKYTFASMLGIMLAIFFMFIIVLVLVVASSSEAPIDVRNNSLLYIKFDQQIYDRAPANPMANFNMMNLMPEPVMGLDDILNSIEYAKTDDRIKGIYLEPSIIRCGIASKEEIRNALNDFKESGKFVLTYSNYFSQSTYYLASVSDKVYLNPAGIFEFIGLSAEIMFYKKAFEKWGIDAQVFRYGKFKSAVEPYLENKLSDENKLQIQALLNSVWNNYLNGISVERNIEKTTLNNIADSLLVRNAKDALTYRLIDGLKYKDEIIEELLDSMDVANIDKLHVVKLPDYINTVKSTNKKSTGKDKIAVIYAYGSVVMGEQQDGAVASETISRAIRKARMDSSIRAIVFRVNSPGGLVIAADIIWREVMLASKIKPVIASMGDYAASGGYYIVAPADTIVANPNTITGSIGVFAVWFSGGKLLKDKVGITYDYVETNEHSNLQSVLKRLDNEEGAYIQNSVDDIYIDFISKVAEGRNMTIQDVDSIGQGRVWSGADAMNLGLVDVEGGLHEAIQIAAAKAGLEKYQIISLPEQEEPFVAFLKQLGIEAKSRILKKELGEFYEDYQFVKELLNQKGLQAIIPYKMSID